VIPLRSIAVLPFVALGSEEDLTYLGDGIAGEILRGLGRAPDLLVAARSSSFKLRGEDARTVRDRLGVAYVLEGSIQRSGDQVRVTVAMIATLDESTLWSDQFQGDFTDVFAIQDSIAHGVFERLRLEFTSGGARVVNLSTDDPRAFTEYLRGRSAANQRTPAGLQEGISHYTNAIELDPGFAEAHAALAIAHTFQGVALSATSETAYSAALVAAEEALRLDPSNAEAHAALATVRSHWQWDFSGAEEEFQRALALQPQYAGARQRYSQLLQVMGRNDEAIAQAEEALRTDDLSITSHVALSVSYYMAGRYTDALDRLDSALDRFPEAPGIHEIRGWTLRALGRFEEAVEAHQTAVSGGQGLLAEGSLAIALSSAGRLDEARTLVRHLETEDRRFPVLAVRLALVYAHLDEIDTAFDHLERAYERRDPWLTFANIDPAFAPLQDNPRFRDLIERVGLPSGGGGGAGGSEGGL
jgi:serine/threonine-protein kinase